MPKEEARKVQRTAQYVEFMERVRGDVLRCMLQNSILDICADDFAHMQEEEAIKGHRSDKPINEIMSCMDIRHCKDMQVSALQWHPRHQRLHGVRSFSPYFQCMRHMHTCTSLTPVFYDPLTHERPNSLFYT
jgi:hypothetical protein